MIRALGEKDRRIFSNENMGMSVHRKAGRAKRRWIEWIDVIQKDTKKKGVHREAHKGPKTINVFRACLGAQLTICAQKLRNFVLFSTVSLRFVLSRVCVFLYI